MTRLRGVFVAASALLSALHPVPGSASDGYGCGGDWRIPSAECRVRLQGLPITVYGNAIGPGAEVRVSLVIPTFADVLVLECHATDASDPPVDGVASCSSVLVADEDVLAPLPEGTVRCRVEGKTAATPQPPGDYFCRTGTVGLPVAGVAG
jgi:hypothetical protein